MRELIDRQALIAEYDRVHVGKPGGARKLMVDAPTIEERKTGEWEETDDGWEGTYYVCSECGCPWTLIDGTPKDNGMNFCPNCGADMRGKNGNAD